MKILVLNAGSSSQKNSLYELKAEGGCSVDTTMGFTSLEGLMMGSRSGSIDPGLLLHLLRQPNYSVDQLDHLLNQESGLRGISGLSSDLREVLAAMRRGDSRAQLAFDVYVHSLRTHIGAMLASLGGEKDPKMLEGFTPDHVGAVAKQVLNRCEGKG
jgi:acetate kinase